MYFTYLLGWTKFNKFYYGVRYKDGVTPDSLGTTYFSSSRYVKKFIEENGSPDIMQVRRMFTCKIKARKWEDKVIRRLSIVYSDKWLNKSNPNAFRDVVMDEDIKKRISEAKRGCKNGKYYNNGVIHKVIKEDEDVPEGWQLGRIHSEKQLAHHKKLNSLLTPEKRKAAAVKCAAKTKGKPKPEGHGDKVSKALMGIKRPYNEGDNNPARRPEVREKISKAKKGKSLNGSIYNNGSENVFIHHGEEIPFGFKKGVLLSPAGLQRQKNKFKGKPTYRWYTNGIETIRAYEGDQPEGWWHGRVLNAE